MSEICQEPFLYQVKQCQSHIADLGDRMAQFWNNLKPWFESINSKVNPGGELQQQLEHVVETRIEEAKEEILEEVHSKFGEVEMDSKMQEFEKSLEEAKDRTLVEAKNTIREQSRDMLRQKVITPSFVTFCWKLKVNNLFLTFSIV